jgi:hypothetical protein
MAWTSLGSALARSEHCELEIGPGVAEVTPRADPARTLVRFFERTLTAGLAAFHPEHRAPRSGDQAPRARLDGRRHCLPLLDVLP